LTITATDKESGLASSPYSFDGGSTWQVEATKTYTSNQTVNIWVKDNAGNIEKQTVEISKIDTLAPTNVTLTKGSVTSSSITVTASATQNQMGIRGYQFSIDGGAYLTEQTSVSKTYTGLSKNTSHSFKVKAIGKNGKETESSTITVSTNDISVPTYSVSPSGDIWATSKTVTITYPGTKTENLVYEYSKDGGSTWTSVTTSSVSVTFTSNGNVIARVRDTENTANTVTASTLTVTKIDATKPIIQVGSTITILQGTNYDTMTGVSASDAGSGIKSLTASITNTASLAVGTYTITYTATDYAGNVITTTRQLKIVRKTDSLIRNGYIEYGDNTNFPDLNYVSESGVEFLRSSTNNEKIFENSDFIPIESSKTYYQEITIRTNNSNSFNYVGFKEYDYDKNEIRAANVAYVTGTLTTLSKDLNPGDTVIYFTDLSKFAISSSLPYYNLGLIFWNYKDSRGYQYPAETYSRNYSWDLYNYNQINKENHTITLKRPWSGQTMKVGTEVSQSSDGMVYNYGLIPGSYLPVGVWKTYSNTITGTTTWPNQDLNKFRHATKYIRFFCLENYSYAGHTPVTGLKTDYRNFIFKEIN
ncbi:MAG: DUF5011 domain-containing protein, partial [Firmicutes bacterium]|nr:DUF5011 domain-containing protein [Bacillota bacterium]